MATERLRQDIVPDIKPIISVSHETEERSSIGVALLIVGLDPRKNGDNVTDPLIWTITELQGKAETEKRAGEISIPAETKKLGESIRSNILGALAEFCDENAVAHLTDHLFLLEDFYREKGIIVKGNPVDLALLVYDGPLDIYFNPQNSTEVSGNGWVSRSEIQKMNNIRTALNSAIECDLTENLTSRALEAYYEGFGRTPIFPQGFSMEQFYVKREVLPDVPILLRA